MRLPRCLRSRSISSSAMPASSRSAMRRSSAWAPIPPGIISKWGWGEPITLLLIGGFAAGLLGVVTSFIIAPFRHLALIMITLGLGLLLREAANSASWLTGGADGLQGVTIWPIFNYFRIRPVGLHRLQLFADRAVRAVSRLPPADPFAVRPGAARHPRKRGAHAGDRRPEPRPYPHHLHDLGGGRRHCRCADLRDHLDGVAGGVELRALRRRPGDADRRRHRPALWRAGRLDHLHGRARPVFRPQSAILVFLDRAVAGAGGDVPAERRARRAVAAVGVIGGAGRHEHGGAGDARARQEFRLAGGGKRHRTVAAGRRALCADRSQRRRQDHADQSAHRGAATRRRRNPARRPGHHRPRRRMPGSSAGWCAPSRSTRCSRTSIRWSR